MQGLSIKEIIDRRFFQKSNPMDVLPRNNKNNNDDNDDDKRSRTDKRKAIVEKESRSPVKKTKNECAGKNYPSSTVDNFLKQERDITNESLPRVALQDPNSVSLAPDSLKEHRARLSSFDVAMTEYIQMFEASEEHVKKLNGTNHFVKQSTIGLRCTFCRKESTASSSYPNELPNFPRHCHYMVSRHFLRCCPSIPPAVQNHLRVTKSLKRKTTRAGSKDVNPYTLPRYLAMVVKEYDLTDNGEAKGIRRRAHWP